MTIAHDGWTLARAATLAALACACAAAAVRPEAAVGAPVRGKLVVVGRVLGDVAYNGVYVVNADGSGLRQVVRSSVATDPHWSRDGRQIAFFTEGLLRNRIVLVTADGSRRREFTAAGPALHSPDPWSPDGKRIAWGGCSGLCVLDLPTSRRRALPLGYDDVLGYAWAPDGRRLAAVDAEERLVVVGVVDGARRVVAPGPAREPAWSPDGRWIAFVDRQARLRLVAAAGGRARVLAARARTPRWSPDGRRLLWLASASGPGRSSLRTVDIATRATASVGPVGVSAIGRWAPNGSGLAIERDRGAYWLGSDVWIVGAGRGMRPVTQAYPTGVSYGEPDWAPGSVPVRPIPAPASIALSAAAVLRTDSLPGLVPAGPGARVAYRDATICDPYTTESGSLTVWDARVGSRVTTTTSCGDSVPSAYAVSADLVAWLVDGGYRPPWTELVVAPPGRGSLAGWRTQREERDIGWVHDIEDLVAAGSLLSFQTVIYGGGQSRRQLWRIVDAAQPRAVPIPLPPDAGATVSGDAERLLLETAGGGLLVLAADGTVLARTLPLAFNSAQLGGDLFGAVGGTTLTVFGATGGSILQRVELDRSAGRPRLLALRGGYAIYASGIAVHLLRLADGLDRVLELPGQAGPVDAVLTDEGLFVRYDRAYEEPAGNLIFVPRPNLP